MVRSQCLKPINKILWVVKSGVETIDAEQICIERVGEKAMLLFLLLETLYQELRISSFCQKKQLCFVEIAKRNVR